MLPPLGIKMFRLVVKTLCIQMSDSKSKENKIHDFWDDTIFEIGRVYTATASVERITIETISTPKIMKLGKKIF